MNYFVTGGTGFIGQNLIEEIFERKRQATVYVLVRSGSRHKLDRLKEKLGRRANRLIPITGDLTRSMLGIPAAKRRELKGKISHVYHLGAVYDLGADADTQISVNVNGTRNTVRFAEDIGARKFHLVSSIAAAGLYPGIFRE
ncbi:MAG: NAD-dependent epimerase/dehydratase family protein, partial [Xanthomonadales bacterium]|nr:NAD-dependent epimerase/dehydratase family protein [Xanthomonadales bacterium]